MKKIIKVIEKTGFEIVDRRRATNTSSCYLDIIYESVELKIRYADHADCYATSDINVAKPNSNNVDGISLKRLAEKLNEIVVEEDNRIVEEEINDTTDYRPTTKLQHAIMFNINGIDKTISMHEYNKTPKRQIELYFKRLELN